MEKNIFEQWQNENKFFIQTKAFKEVEKLIKSQNLVIVGGHSGSGKSAIIQHIALKYRNQGWIVIPIYRVQEIINVFNNKKEVSNETLFVFNDPIGKDTFDAIEFNEWERNEERLTACLKNVKLLLTCRTYILSDKRLKGLLKEKSYTVDINDEKLKLDNQEKQNIWNSYSSNKKLSKEELTELVQIEAYFPLLCKLYFTNDRHQREGLRFFKEPFAFLEKELRTFRISYIEKYCALVLLILFDNVLYMEGIIRDNTTKEKFEHALWLCGMYLKTPPSFIIDSLESLNGSFVKKIGEKFHFLHDVVMEVTIYVFGSDYPADIIQYADIGIIRRRVKLRCSNDKDNDLSIYIEDKNIVDLAKRFLTEIFRERLLDVVLNPSLKSEKVIEIFINQLKDSPEKYKLLLEKKVLQIEKQELYKATKHLFLSKLAFVNIGNGVSPLCALIVFSHTELSLHCLEVLKEMQEDIHDIALFSAVCCSGSLDLFEMFLKDKVEILLTKQWGYLYPIHVVSAYHNPEILCEIIQFDLDVNLKTDKDGNTPLIYAAGNDTKDYIEDAHNEISSEDRRNETVNLLLELNAHIDLCNKKDVTPLYIASNDGHTSTVELLLSKGAKINLCDKDGASPLCISCQNGHVSSVEILLKNKADMHLCTTNEVSPLYAACENRHDRIVKLLLDNGANVNLCEKQGLSPLSIACQNGHDSTVQLLLNNKADINLCEKQGLSPLHIACQNGHENIVLTLIENGADVKKCKNKGTSPLYIACQNGHVNIVELLISKGADINLCEINDGASPLHIACQNGHNSIIQLLLNQSAKINLRKKNGASPLSVACGSGHLHSVKLLLRKKANINLCAENGASPLYIACQNGHVKTVEHLLENGADINLCANNESSPLFIACENGHEKTVELLMNQGANIDHCNTKGCSSLYTACDNGYDKIVRLLLENGSNVNLCEQNGFSPLYIASLNKHDSTVRLLLNKDADINLCTKYGDSPLFIACQNGSYSTVKILLGKKADINLCTNDGSSPLFIACYHTHYNTVQLLLNNGANINLCAKNEISPLSVCFVCKNSDIDKTFFLRNTDILHKYGCAFGYIYFYCDDKDNDNKLFLFHKKNYKDSIIGPDTYDCLLAFCQVEELLRMFVNN